jgi:hypothetical protein
MMDEMPGLRGRSHGGGGMNSQARRHGLEDSVESLRNTGRSAENEQSVAPLLRKMSCPPPALSGKRLFNSVILRSFSYWFVSSVVGILLVGAAETGMASSLSFTLPADAASSVMPVPEPSRAVLLFAGIMAMAFTYRRAWLSWKRGSQP